MAVRLVGAFPLFLIQPLHTYPLAVLHVALILTHELYLYVHAPFTLDTHVHLFTVNSYGFLVYQHAYIVSAPMISSSVNDAGIVLGSHTLVHLYFAHVELGVVHISANVTGSLISGYT